MSVAVAFLLAGKSRAFSLLQRLHLNSMKAAAVLQH